MSKLSTVLMTAALLSLSTIPAAAYTGQQSAQNHGRTAGDSSFSRCLEQFAGGKPPVVTNSRDMRTRALCFNGFAVLHSGKTKTPVYAAEVLNRERIMAARNGKRTDNFYEEARLPAADRALLSDYRGNAPYSRGHQVPAADSASPEGMAQSFSLANIVPQHAINNSKAWANYEKATRSYVMRARGDVYVVTGPAFIRGQCPFVKEAKEALGSAGVPIPSNDTMAVMAAQVTGLKTPRKYDASACTIGSGVSVPSHLFKLVYDASANRAWAYWMENTAQTRGYPPISYAELVQLTGIEFLPGIRPAN